MTHFLTDTSVYAPDHDDTSQVLLLFFFYVFIFNYHSSILYYKEYNKYNIILISIIAVILWN